MYRVRRDKDGSTHYATAVEPRGNITGWSRDAARAVAVTEGVARRVRAYHERRRNVGVLSYEPVDATVSQLAQAVAADDAVGTAEFIRLQAECQRLEEEAEDLRARVRETERHADMARQGEQRATARVTEIEAAYAEQSQRCQELARHVAEREARPQPANHEQAEPDGRPRAVSKPQLPRRQLGK